MTRHQYPLVPPGIPTAQPQAYHQQGSPQQAFPMAPNQRQSTASYRSSYLELGKLGAVVGLCGAGAANLRRLQADQVSSSEALFDTLRTGVAAGLVTATAGFVANQFRSPTVSLLATIATGTAMMYVLNTEASAKVAPVAHAGDRA